VIRHGQTSIIFGFRRIAQGYWPVSVTEFSQSRVCRLLDIPGSGER
jgi:hypothetical protein